jgi:hypothetical protein
MYKYAVVPGEEIGTLRDSFIWTYLGHIIVQIGDDIREGDDACAQKSLALLFPERMTILDPEKCLRKLKEVQLNIKDDYVHRLDAITEHILLSVLQQLDYDKTTYKSHFYPVFFQGSTKSRILKTIKSYYKEDIKDWQKEESEPLTDAQILEAYVSSENFIDETFEDEDVLDIEPFFEKCSQIAPDIPEGFFDEFPNQYDLLPDDVAIQFKNNKNDYGLFLKNLKAAMEYSATEIKGFSSFHEKDYQTLFEIYARGFFRCSFNGKRIIRELKAGNGLMDFCLALPPYGDNVFEIKVDRKDNVLRGIHRQLPEYLKRFESNYGTIVVFSQNPKKNRALYEEEADKAKEPNHVHILMIDVTPKEKPSQKHETKHQEHKILTPEALKSAKK